MYFEKATITNINTYISLKYWKEVAVNIRISTAKKQKWNQECMFPDFEKHL